VGLGDRVEMTGGPSGTWGVFSLGEFLRFPGEGVFLGKHLGVAVWCGRGS